MNVNSYDVTSWPEGNPYEDIGQVINSIIADVHRRQEAEGRAGRGCPGAVIHVPPGDYHLRTPVVIDISFLRLVGEGHGFTSSSIRYNLSAQEASDLHEVWPGGSRILVDLDEGAALTVRRAGSPRISSVEILGLCLDGQHFRGEGPGGNPENSYRNGRIGILVDCPNDSLRLCGNGLVYLEHGIIVRKADALSVHDNFVAECGSCIELTDWGQACKVTDNLVGAGPWGESIYAQNHGGLLISANNVFPRGRSSVRLEGTTRSSVTANRLHTFYPGAIVLDEGCAENLVASNHVLWDDEPWAPFAGVTNGLPADVGTIQVSGRDNSVIGNHVSIALASPGPQAPVAIHLAQGSGHYIASNHVVASQTGVSATQDCYQAQVGALLATAGATRMPAVHVRADASTVGCTVLDSGRASEVDVDPTRHALRPTPEIPVPRALPEVTPPASLPDGVGPSTLMSPGTTLRSTGPSRR